MTACPSCGYDPKTMRLRWWERLLLIVLQGPVR